MYLIIICVINIYCYSRSFLLESGIEFPKHSLEKWFILILSIIIIIGFEVELVAIFIHESKYILDIETVEDSVQLHPAHALPIVPVLRSGLFQPFIQVICHLVGVDCQDLLVQLIEVAIVLLDQSL